MLPPSLEGLVLPSPASPDVRAVFAARTRATLSDYLALTAGRAHATVVDAVRAAMASAPGAAAGACAAPTVAGLVGAARRAPHGGDRVRLVARADAVLALELAARGGLGAPVRVEGLDGAALPCLGARVAFRPVDGALVVTPDGPTDTHGSPLEAIGAAAPLRIGSFAWVDTNPLLDVSGHPDRAGNLLDLGGADVATWAAALDAALAAIAAAMPAYDEELRLGLRTLLPVGRFDERHDSVSFRDSIGAVYLTLHPNTLTLAEAVVHEFQHTKLHAAMRFDPLLEGADDATFVSPLRPDPRPMLGVLMAVHAFVAVEALHDGLRAAGHDLAKSRDFEARAAAVRRSNDEALATVVAHARPTARGRTLVEALQRRLSDPQRPRS